MCVKYIQHEIKLTSTDKTMWVLSTRWVVLLGRKHLFLRGKTCPPWTGDVSIFGAHPSILSQFNLLIFSLSPLICLCFAATTHAHIEMSYRWQVRWLRGSLLQSWLLSDHEWQSECVLCIQMYLRVRACGSMCMCKCVFVCILKDSISHLWGHRCPDVLNTHAHTQQKHTPIAWN